MDPATQRLRQVALMVSSSVRTWTEAAGLAIADGHVLLALSCSDEPASATDIASRGRLSFDDVYPALHHLAAHGYAVEERRLYRLTDGGRQAIADFDREERSKVEAYVAWAVATQEA